MILLRWIKQTWTNLLLGFILNEKQIRQQLAKSSLIYLEPVQTVNIYV